MITPATASKKISKNSFDINRLEKNLESLTESTNKMATVVAERGAILHNQGQNIVELKELMKELMSDSRTTRESNATKMEELRKELHKEIETNFDKLSNKLETSINKVSDDIKAVRNKMTTMEKVYWIFSGVFAVLVFFVDQIKLGSLF